MRAVGTSARQKVSVCHFMHICKPLCWRVENILQPLSKRQFCVEWAIEMVNLKRLCLKQKQRFDLSAVLKFEAAMDRMVRRKNKTKSSVINITAQCQASSFILISPSPVWKLWLLFLPVWLMAAYKPIFQNHGHQLNKGRISTLAGIINACFDNESPWFKVAFILAVRFKVHFLMPAGITSAVLLFEKPHCIMGD